MLLEATVEDQKQIHSGNKRCVFCEEQRHPRSEYSPLARQYIPRSWLQSPRNPGIERRGFRVSGRRKRKSLQPRRRHRRTAANVGVGIRPPAEVRRKGPRRQPWARGRATSVDGSWRVGKRRAIRGCGVHSGLRRQQRHYLDAAWRGMLTREGRERHQPPLKI